MPMTLGMDPDRTSLSSDQGCIECGSRPTFLTPHGLRCRDHIHLDEEWDDWIPLTRKRGQRQVDSAPHRPDGGSAGTRVTVSTPTDGRSIGERDRSSVGDHQSVLANGVSTGR